jgi:hypothetical protein
VAGAVCGYNFLLDNSKPPDVSRCKIPWIENPLITVIYGALILASIVSCVTVGSLRWTARRLGVSLAAVAWALSAWLGFVGWVFWKLWVLWEAAPNFAAFCGLACS